METFKLGDIVRQLKFKDLGEVIEVLPMDRYRVKWLEGGNISTYSRKYLRK